MAVEGMVKKAKEGLDALLAQVWSIDELPGWVSKTLRVPKGHKGLLVGRDRSVKVLQPAFHRVVGFRRRLGRAANLRAAAVVDARKFSLQPRVERLMSGDKKLVEAELLLEAQVDDPGRFYDQVLHGRKTLYASDLANQIAVELEGGLQSGAAEYSSADLSGNLNVVSRVSGRLGGLLSTLLESKGLRLVDLQHLSFRDRVSELQRLEKARPLERRLREEQTRAQLEKLRSEKELEDALRQIEHEYGLRELIRQQEMEDLKGQFAQGGAAAARVSQSAADVVHEEIEGLEDRIYDQMHKEFLRLEADIEEAEPKRDLKKQAEIALRIAAIILTVAELSLAVLKPEWLQQNERPLLTLILLLLPLALVVVAIVVLRMFQRREEVWLGQPARKRVALPANRAQADRLVRGHIGRQLRKLITDLTDLRTTAFALGLEEWASQVKGTENQADLLRRRVENAQYGGVDFFTKEKVPPVNLARMVEFDREILDDAGILSHLSAEALHQVKAEEAQNAEEIVKELDRELHSLSSRFTDRDTFLRGSI